MRTVGGALVLTGLLIASGPASAQRCVLGSKPASTLLLPYFAVDLAKLNRPKKAEVTEVVITNVSNTDGVAHVVLWTDLTHPTVNWDIPLPPQSTFKIPMHEIFQGELPGHVDGEGTSGIGEDGPQLRAAHSGRESEFFEGQCVSLDHGDRVARGYMTIDALSTSGDMHIAGEVVRQSRKGKYAEVTPLIHLDNDTRIPSDWGARFENNGGDSTLIVWRDTPPSSAYPCGQIEEHEWYPLDAVDVTAYDADGNAVELTSEFPFPARTGAYPVGPSGLSFPHGFGWVEIGLNLDGEASFGFVEVAHRVESGRRRGRTPATALACSQ